MLTPASRPLEIDVDVVNRVFGLSFWCDGVGNLIFNVRMTFPNVGKYVVAWPRITSVSVNRILFKRLGLTFLSVFGQLVANGAMSLF